MEDAHFINSVHNRIRTFVTRRGGSFRCDVYVRLRLTALFYCWKLEREPFSKRTRYSDLGTWARAEPILYRYVQLLHLQASRGSCGNMGNVDAKHARRPEPRTPRSHSRPHSAPGRLATSVRYSV